MNDTPPVNHTRVREDAHYQDAMLSVQRTLDKLHRCTDQEKKRLRHELDQMQEMLTKLTAGRVEIAVFGEISTGKSAMHQRAGRPGRRRSGRAGWMDEGGLARLVERLRLLRARTRRLPGGIGRHARTERSGWLGPGGDGEPGGPPRRI